MTSCEIAPSLIPPYKQRTLGSYPDKTTGVHVKEVKSSGRCEPDNGLKPQPQLQTESVRLETFANWPNRDVSPACLARAGFYAIGHEDAVRCAFCGTEGYRWEAGDDPMKDHAAWNPNCPFVREKLGDKLPPPDTDACGNLEFFPNSAPEDQSILLFKKIGAEKTKPCSHPEHVTLQSRLSSFAQWPKSLKQKPDALAEAGFFYKEIGDQTLCFHCGGGLKDWEESDDPWEQHALWFPKCNYLLLHKGREFVEQVRGKFARTGEEQEQEPSCSTEKQPEPEPEPPKPTKEESSTSSSKDSQSTDDVAEEKSGSTLCKICYKNELGVILLPCKHIVACVDCSLSLNNMCPMCRKKFDSTIRVFLS